MISKNIRRLLDVLGSGLSSPDVKVNRPEPTDLSIFIAQLIELFKEKMEIRASRVHTKSSVPITPNV
jgi:hypothetical protein